MHHHEIKVYTVVGSRDQSFFKFSNIFKEKTLRILSIAILLAAVPTTVYLFGQTQGTQQHAAGCLLQCIKLAGISPSQVLKSDLEHSQEVLVNGQGFAGKVGVLDPLQHAAVLIVNPIVSGEKRSMLSFDAVMYISPTKLKAILPQSLDPGTYDVEVLNPGGDSSVLPKAISIQ